MSHQINQQPLEPAGLCLDRIERRVAGRAMAADLAELIGEKVTDPHFMEALCDTLRARAFPPEAQQPAPVAEHEPIARLGNVRMPFGQHMGRALDDVPLEYLDWLCANQEDFYRDLRAYLKHPDLESRRRGLEQ